MIVIVASIVTTSCSSDDSPMRPAIDERPYFVECDAQDAESCDQPYECVEQDAGHGDETICLVPCSSDDECPAGYFCNGVNTFADLGAHDHCVEDV
jgi:hypothetical protein